MARTYSKSLKAAYEKINKDQVYSLEEALDLMLANSSVKFDATAELHMKLGINPKHADQQIRSTISLPNGTGKSVKVAVFAEDEHHAAAKKAGAAEVGAEDLVEKVAKGWTDFDVAVATPGMMRHLAKAARVLGPKGLMPNPKAGTVTPDVEKTVTELVAGRLEFRNDKAGIIHTIFGKLSFGKEKLLENLKAMITAIKAAKPTGQKGEYLKTITINSTMGAGIRINIETL